VKSRLQFHVIASGAKQSIRSSRGKMDCFAALAMTAWGSLAMTARAMALRSQ